jgi:predicted Fe-S protein YdhL (DUF1289 family)
MRRINKNKPKFITPCIHVCHLENGVCIGCKRTEEEISNWFFYDDKKKLEIMEKLNMQIMN